MRHSSSNRPWCTVPLAGLCLGLALCGSASETRAQYAGGGSVPSQIYFNALPGFYDGNHRAALATFTAESQGAIKTPTSLWLDSICYYAMMGECQYQLGQPAAALASYDAALKLYVQYSDWMMRVQFEPVTPAAGVSRATPWGQSKRRARVGLFKDTYRMSQGQFNAATVLQQGGVLQQPVMFPVHASEIVRATSLAIRRRRELLGPLGASDPLNDDLINALSRRPSPPNHWSEAWVQLQLGCAYAAAGRVPQATTALQRSLLVSGEYDHPLTSTALVELGRLSLEAGDFAAALQFFEEATYASFLYADPGNMEEAFRFGLVAHLLLNQRSPYPPLANAIAWAKSNGYQHLQASLLLSATENMATLGDTAQANNLLSTAQAIAGRTDLGIGQTGARANHLSSLVAYQAGNVEAGDKALAAALAFQRGGGSTWMFQISLTDQRYVAGNLSDRAGLSLYQTLLRDPAPGDWAYSPLECLSVLTTPHHAAIEHWFEAALQRGKEQELALEIADRGRRHRFFTTLPMGGRLLALRWILEGPPEQVGRKGMLQRQELLARHPQYARLAQEAQKIRGQLAAGPLVDEAADARRQQAALLASLAETCEKQEVLLRQMAVRRDPTDLVFPPVRSTAEVQRLLPDGQVLLAFFETSRALHAFLYSNSQYAAWHVQSPAQLQRLIPTLLRDIGNHDVNHELAESQFTKSSWRATAAGVRDVLLDKSNVVLKGDFREITIVPDGILWYLPFELLSVGNNQDERLLISQSRVRYAPTVGLAVSTGAVQRRQRKLGVVVGKLHPGDDDSLSQAALEQLGRAVPGVVALPRSLPAASSVYAPLVDGLIVLDDIEPDEGAYGWSPMQLDRGKLGAALSHWFSLPYGAPEQMILPGFHTMAESGLRKSAAAGNDLFLSLCGLMSEGARTILISRWRTGGQTSVDLVREFVQELPHGTPAEAWQRSVQIAIDTPIDPRSEPRVSRTIDPAAVPKAGYPFFWSGYMLVDSGALSEAEAKALAAAQPPAPAQEAPQPADGRLLPAIVEPPGPAAPEAKAADKKGSAAKKAAGSGRPGRRTPKKASPPRPSKTAGDE